MNEDLSENRILKYFNEQTARDYENGFGHDDGLDDSDELNDLCDAMDAFADCT